MLMPYGMLLYKSNALDVALIDAAWECDEASNIISMLRLYRMQS
jgi:hypothetical protein